MRRLKPDPIPDDLIRKIETARAGGLHITADMYTYTAGQTGLGNKLLR